MLEIGPGKSKISDEWVTVNIIKTPQTDFVVEWGWDRLPFEKESFDLVYASHCLEHVPWSQTIFALKDAYRILKKGGAIEVWVPDFKYVIDCYLKKKCGDDWRKYNEDSNYMTWVNGRIFTYGENPHMAVFDKEYLVKSLNKAGFRDCKLLQKPRGYDHGKINLGIRGEK